MKICSRNQSTCHFCRGFLGGFSSWEYTLRICHQVLRFPLCLQSIFRNMVYRKNLNPPLWWNFKGRWVPYSWSSSLSTILHYTLSISQPTDLIRCCVILNVTSGSAAVNLNTYCHFPHRLHSHLILESQFSKRQNFYSWPSARFQWAFWLRFWCCVVVDTIADDSQHSNCPVFAKLMSYVLKH